MDIFSRILQVVEIESKGNQSEFAKGAGIKYETLRTMLKYRRSYPGYDVLQKILRAYSWVDAGWLMTGEGEMKKQNYQVTEATPEFLLKRLEELVLENSRLKEENKSLKEQKKGAGYSIAAES